MNLRSRGPLLGAEPAGLVESARTAVRRVDVLPVAELPLPAAREWTRTARGQQLSPFLYPGFAQAVGAGRRDAMVALLEADDGALGFFPFEQGPGRSGRAVGMGLNDMQGAVLPSHVGIEAPELVSRAGLSSWRFDHLPVGRPGFAAFEWLVTESPYLDLSAGFECYRAERRASGSVVLQEAQRKLRKLSREVGPVRLEYDSDDGEAFALMLRWKAEQRRRTRTFDVLQTPWATRAVEHLREHRSPQSGARLSVLYAGDEIAAVHLGLVANGVLHWWLPTYNSALGSYSPGLVLLQELARAAAAEGVHRIDLGKGDELYKRRAASGAIGVAAGSVQPRIAPRLALRAWYLGREHARQTPLRPLVHAFRRAPWRPGSVAL